MAVGGHRLPAVELLVGELADARLVGDAQHAGHGEDDFRVAVRVSAVHVGGPPGVAQQAFQQVRHAGRSAALNTVESKTSSVSST